MFHQVFFFSSQLSSQVMTVLCVLSQKHMYVYKSLCVGPDSSHCCSAWEENQSINQPSFCNSWWFCLTEMLDKLCGLSRMSWCSGKGRNCCIWDKNHVSTWFWHTVDVYLSGVWRCFNLLKWSLHTSWGVNRAFCGSMAAGHQQVPSVFMILRSFEVRSVIPVSMCAERCGVYPAGSFVSLNASRPPSVFLSISSVISV